jgi:hypothetical protein
MSIELPFLTFLGYRQLEAQLVFKVSHTFKNPERPFFTCDHFRTEMKEISMKLIELFPVPRVDMKIYFGSN